MTNRINLSDGRWFDSDRAERWPEARRHDGHNWISLATGSQWKHETLYRTAQGRWVLHRSSQSRDIYQEIAPQRAVAWLIVNGHEAAAEAVDAGRVAALEA